MVRARLTKPPSGVVAALTTGREAPIGQALNQHRAPVESRPASGPFPSPDPPAPSPPAPQASPDQNPADGALRSLLRSRRSLRRAMLVAEVLGPPRGMRREER